MTKTPEVPPRPTGGGSKKTDQRKRKQSTSSGGKPRKKSKHPTSSTPMQENSVAKGSKTNSGRIQGSSSQKENNEPVSPVVTNGKEMGSWIRGGTEKEDRPLTSSMTKDGSRMKSSKKQKKKRSSSSNTIISEETERDPEIEKAKREWNDHYKNNRERKSNTKRILRNYVKNHIFPNCKFLTEEMVKFSRKKKSLSRKICSEFKIPERIWSFWWEDYVGFIKECMKERRASAVSNMKAEYYALKDACKADPDGPDTACPLEGVLKMRCMVPIDGSKSPMMVPNPDYVDFCKFYLPYTVGKKDRFKPFCTEQHISEFVTVTDEVFAIISYENSEQRWEAGYQEDLKEAQEQLKNDYLALTRRNTKTGKKRKKSVEDQEDEDHVGDRGKLSAGCRVNVPNKYTNTPKVDEKAGSNRRLCGWSEEGMRRFNKLKDMVAKNRQEECAQEFEEAVRQACIELYGNKKVQTDEEDTSTKPLSVEAKHDLFSDTSDDDEGEEESRSNSTDDGSQKSENDGGEEESSEDEE